MLSVRCLLHRVHHSFMHCTRQVLRHVTEVGCTLKLRRQNSILTLAECCRCLVLSSRSSGSTCLHIVYTESTQRQVRGEQQHQDCGRWVSTQLATSRDARVALSSSSLRAGYVVMSTYFCAAWGRIEAMYLHRCQCRLQQEHMSLHSLWRRDHDLG